MNLVQGIPQNRIDEVLEWSYKLFEDKMDKSDFKTYLNYVSNFDLSIMLLDDNDKLFGVYILGNNQITQFTKDALYENLNGVEGVLLGVDKSIMGNGYGTKLKDYTKTLGFDYVWGQQLKSLNNLTHWLKRRKLVAITGDVYITAEIFKG